MSGPVWRFEAATEASCSVCYRAVSGVYVEGEIADNQMHVGRRVCPECYGRLTRMLVRGELGRRSTGPAYVRR
jgi:hypothetical protein